MTSPESADPAEPELSTTFHLVREAKDGQLEALGALFDRYYRRVRKVVQLRLGAKLRGVMDANDILQETFIGAIKSFDRFEMRNEASVINWLSRIAERAIKRSAQRFSAAKRGKGMQVPIDDGDTKNPAFQVVDDKRGPGTTVGAHEESEIVEECISELPEQYREIIVLRNYVEYPWEDVAREHGRPSVDAARMMHAKAMLELDKRIRQRLDDAV